MNFLPLHLSVGVLALGQAPRSLRRFPAFQAMSPVVTAESGGGGIEGNAGLDPGGGHHAACGARSNPQCPADGDQDPCPQWRHPTRSGSRPAPPPAGRTPLSSSL